MENKEKKEYSGCLSVLLPLWIIGQILTIIYNLAFAGFYIDFPLIPIILIGTNIIALVGIILLLQFKKIGFYIYILTFVITFLVGVFFPDYVKDNTIFRSIFGLGLFLLLMSFKNKETKLNGFQTLELFSSKPKVYTDIEEKQNKEESSSENITDSSQEVVHSVESTMKYIIDNCGQGEPSASTNEIETTQSIIGEKYTPTISSLPTKGKKPNICKITIVLVSFFTILVSGILFFIVDWRTDDEIFKDAKYLIEHQQYERGINELKQIQERFIPAKALLGKLYCLNDSIERNTEYGEKLLWEAYEANDTTACLALSDIYIEKEDWEKSKQIFEKAIELGLWTGYRGMSALYYFKEMGGAINIHKDYKKAEYYALKIADKDSWCCFFLGFIYSEGGDGIEQDYSKAYYWWNKGAELGETKSEDCFSNLGWLYHNGYGVKQNYKKAYESYKKAIQINEKDNYSYYQLSLMFRHGQYVKANPDSVKYYLKKAAEYGNVDASVEIENEQ